MNFQDIKSKAMQALGKHPDKAESGIDKAGSHAKERFGHEQQVDSATDKAKGYVSQQNEGEGSQGDQGNQGDQNNPGRSDQP